METFEWICVALLAFIMGIFNGYFTLHSIEDWIDSERKWKAMKKEWDEKYGEGKDDEQIH